MKRTIIFAAASLWAASAAAHPPEECRTALAGHTRHADAFAETRKVTRPALARLLAAWDEIEAADSHAKGMNLQRKAKDGFARLMEDFDLLLMPTVPLVAQPFPAADASIAEYCDHAWNMLANCPTYNYTGQPSMSVPCGTVDGLPVGLMITGRWWEEPTVYRAAAAFEANFDWRSL